MKKLFLFAGIVLLAAGFASCSSDDDNEMPEERILGIWNIDRLLIDENFVELNECERRSTIQFFAGGDFTETIYDGENPASCRNFTIDGNWRRLANGGYELEYPEEEFTVNATIASSELTMQYTLDDEDEGEQEYVRIYRKN
ncbi:hypothetical protein FHG64_10975 [Antarcticibacterium flavum]|uniref:Lipocalin-like domain-containing protein n=1 Tax=Antarcticibacterium flavum TaxID=2058175 RepID=A0A5B7X3G0_9FLAO|nr:MULTISPECIES: lipocalin family protein [Antarcticibacterium]MCM4159485.1 hypothetical protein [Antarcticibacterium sp. W02-3]QCY69879.1 hypothetical protein FHG64_10975 [Antarcticibacterium flavum]